MWSVFGPKNVVLGEFALSHAAYFLIGWSIYFSFISEIRIVIVKRQTGNCTNMTDFYDLKAKRLDGTEINFSEFRGKAVLVQ